MLMLMNQSFSKETGWHNLCTYLLSYGLENRSSIPCAGKNFSLLRIFYPVAGADVACGEIDKAVHQPGCKMRTHLYLITRYVNVEKE